MSTLQIPPPETAHDLQQQSALGLGVGRVPVTAEEVPILLIRMQDELSRSRKREAAWLSVILHLLLVMGLVNSDKLARLLPGYTVVAMTPADLTRQQDTTFLALPPDEQQVSKRPDTNVISDKDRIVASRKPQLDRQELKKILDESRPGRPGAPAPQGAQAPAPAPSGGGAQQAGAGSPQVAPDSPSDHVAELQAPPVGRTIPKSVFGGGMSAGSAIDQAARASVANRGGSSAGEGGEFGLSQRGGFKAATGAEILTDTRGVDFGPYLARVKQVVKTNWYNVIPESARPPILKKGRVAIRFFIMKDGSVASMQWEGSSGDVSLDRAAWGAITASHPFPPLPREFTGDYLGLRFFFFYNPDARDFQ